MSDWSHGTCPRHSECTFYQNVACSPLLRVKYATMYPYCKAGKHASCMRWWVMERGEPVADGLLPDGGRDLFAKEAGKRESSARRRIMVVDDLPMFRNAVVALAGNASKNRCAIEEAASAESALETLLSSPTDWALLITDFHMGGMSGYDLIVRMRSHPGLSSVPAIVFSSELDPAVKERCGALPMVRWLEKRPLQSEFDKAWNELVVGREA